MHKDARNWEIGGLFISGRGREKKVTKKKVLKDNFKNLLIAHSFLYARLFY
jgi:hypothetical protein